MVLKEREALVAPCGIDCGICEMYTCKDNEVLYEALIAKGFTKDKIPCNGCRSIKGNCPVIPNTCDTYSCIGKKGFDFCSECKEFPCGMLQPSSDRANILPHNLKVYNLCLIRKIGVEEFTKSSTEIKYKYYKGKMIVGKGPVIIKE